mmetsp:Transcript_24346/g.39238  ORF Transcript_24346/g.39238 Transcript_24346/m.39238 type:complete len:83 (-) Transcript_24346:28-276(-)
MLLCVTYAASILAFAFLSSMIQECEISGCKHRGFQLEARLYPPFWNNILMQCSATAHLEQLEEWVPLPTTDLSTWISSGGIQ